MNASPESRQKMEEAFVLAAGLGTRMRPLTDFRPKPLVEVAGKTLLDHNLDALAAASVSRAVVNVHYLADQIIDHVSARKAPQTMVSDERDLLRDSGGGVRHGLHLLQGETFYVLNADSFWIDGQRDNLAALREAWKPQSMDILLLLAPTQEAVGFSGRGDFHRDGDGRLTRRGTADAAPFVYAGAMIAKRSLFVAETDEIFSLNRLFDDAIEKGRLHGTGMEGLWLHVGTPDAIGEAERAVAERP